MKTYHIIKTAVLGQHLEQGAKVSVRAKSYLEALKSIGAQQPSLHSQHASVCIFKCINNWVYLVTFEKA